MMQDELHARLAEYDDWRAPVGDGWLAMPDLDLLAHPIEYLLADGTRTRRPNTSNADWIVSGLRPVAWRRPVPPATDAADFSVLHGGII